MIDTIAAEKAKPNVRPAAAKRAAQAELFTLSQIQESHSRMKNGADFPAFVRALISFGVTGYDLFVQDRHAQYFGRNNFTLKEDAKYPEFAVASKVDNERLGSLLKTYNMGKTNYMTFCEQIARAGIEKWTLNVKQMTCTYYDAHGTAVIVEHVPGA